MLKTPLYWIAAFNFTCSQISLIYIQSMQHGMQNGAKCNLNAINLEINSWKKMKKRIQGTTWKGQMLLPNIHLNKGT